MADESFYREMLKSQQEQIAALSAMIASMSRGAPTAHPQPMPPPISGKRIKMKDLCVMFLEAKQRTVRAGTVSSYKHLLLRADFTRPLHDLYADELTHSVIQQRIDECPPSRGVRESVATVKNMLKWARARKLCDVPPHDPDSYEYKRGAPCNPHEEIPEEDFARIEEAAFDCFEDSVAARGVYIGLSCGLRIGEVCGLKWSDYDPSDNMLSISRGVSRACKLTGGTVLVVGDTKTDAGHRRIPVRKELAPLLAAHAGEDGYICVRQGKKARRVYECTEPRNLRSAIRRWCALNDLPRFHFHSLRHTFISRKIRGGAPIKAVSRYVGHTDVRITLGTYAHVNGVDLEKVAG